MDKLDQALSLLDVKIDEEFKLKNFGNSVFVFRRYGYVLGREEGSRVFEDTGMTLTDFLNGKYIILKQKQYPKAGTQYYYVSNKGKILCDTWTGITFDCTLYKIGNYYLTDKVITEEEMQKWRNFYRESSLIEWYG